MADNRDSFDHVVKTAEQWESRSYEYWIIPRGVLCVELTPDKKTKIKIGEGNKIYSQLPYINSEADLSDYYTKEEIDNILAMLNFVAIPSSEIYPTKESLPQTGNRQGDLRFVRNVGGDPYSYLWFNNKWIQVGGVDLSEYAKKSEVNPRLNALELKAHTHANKSVLDRLTANVIDDSHRHVNKNILDATTAPYTTQDKATLDALAAITVFEGATKTEDGTMGYVPAPLQGQQSYYLKGDGTWATPTDTDTKVNVTLATTTKAYLLGTSTTPTATAQGVTSVADTGVYLDTTAGGLCATNVKASATVCANTANSNNAGGIALYGTDPTTYGIMFRGTSNSGKHGYVQSDWATYLTMNGGGTTRGWVFRRGTTNVASISGAGNAVFNGSVTVGGNSTNTSGCRMEYNSTTQTLDFVFA